MASKLFYCMHTFFYSVCLCCSCRSISFKSMFSVNSFPREGKQTEFPIFERRELYLIFLIKFLYSSLIAYCCVYVSFSASSPVYMFFFLFISRQKKVSKEENNLKVSFAFQLCSSKRDRIPPSNERSRCMCRVQTQPNRHRKITTKSMFSVHEKYALLL